MTRVGRRLIEDFLLPALNDQRYGDLLKWIDQDKYYFSIRWSHKNAAKWTLQDTAVFQDWDKLKGHYHPEIKGYYMQAKQRFRAALYKLNTVRKLPCDDKHVKKYQLVLDNEKKNCLGFMGKRVRKIAKAEEPQRSIPTSVICKNMAYVEKNSSSNEAFSPAVNIKTEDPEPPEDEEMFDDDDDEEEEEYEEVKRPERYVCPHHEHLLLAAERAEALYKDGILPEERDIPSNNDNHRTPHVPIQPVPLYNKSNHRVMSASRRFESPRLIVVPIYSSFTSKNCIREVEEHYDDSFDENSDDNSDTALNLSVKHEASSPEVSDS